MRTLNRHLRGLLVAVAALSISASAVFAAAAHSGNGPADAAADGLKRAAETTGSTVPTRSDQTIKDADDDETIETIETIESETANEASTNAADRPLNHGWYVSTAAKLATPAGYDNHGAYVSSVAKGNLGKPASASDASEKNAKGQANAAAAKARAAQRQAARQP